MRAISNYIAALIAASMIFTSIAFLISLSLRQVELSNYALNTMVEISDRTRENVATSYVIEDNYMILTIANIGEIDVELHYLVFILRNLTAIKVALNDTRIAIGTIATLRIRLPTDMARIDSVKLVTKRGNVFDVFASKKKPVQVTVDTNTTTVAPGETIELRIIIHNYLNEKIIVSPDYIETYFFDNDDNLTTLFTRLDTSYPPPGTYTELGPGETTRFIILYKYNGGADPGTPVDIHLYIKAYSGLGVIIESQETLVDMFYTN